MRSIIKVSNVYMEDLFSWFYNHIMNSGGDGCGYIVCENYKETANWFVEWYQDFVLPSWHHMLTEEGKENIKLNGGFFHPKEETENTINFHDLNENFIFTSNMEFNSFAGDYIFMVCGDCRSYRDLNKKLVAIT